MNLDKPETKGLSIVFPVHGENLFLEQSLLSILNQEMPTDWELVVVLDRPSKTSLAILEGYRFANMRLIEAYSSGISSAHNAGLVGSIFDLVAIAHSDDISLPKRFLKQYEFLRAYSNFVCLGTQIELINHKDEHIQFASYPKKVAITRRAFRYKSVVAHPSVMYRRNVVLEAGGYRQEYAPADDYDLWVRLLQFGEITNLDETLLRYRRHVGQVSSLQIIDQIEKKSQVIIDNFYPNRAAKPFSALTKALKWKLIYSEELLNRGAETRQAGKRGRALVFYVLVSLLRPKMAMALIAIRYS